MAKARKVGLIEVGLPEFGEPTVEPAIPTAVHEARVAGALARAKAEGLDALIVYGDREHTASMTYLTGYDPRFEEAILILVPGRLPTLLVGNEGMAYATLANGRFETVAFPALSLMGQPRDGMRPLDAELRAAGLAPGMRIGSVGWKGFEADDIGFDSHWLEIPSYLADALRALSGPKGVINANHLFMNPRDGLRAINEVEQLACFEFSSTFSSQGLRNVLFNVRPGVSELQAARLMAINALPGCAYPVLSGGERARVGLGSPTLRPLQRGEPFFMGYGLWGSMNARGGFLVEDERELPEEIRDYVPKLVAPYFRAVVAWYETIGIGVPGRALYDAVHAIIGDPFFGVKLNPGHLIHIDEWMHSPVKRGSETKFRSGMAVQMDIIPATGAKYFSSNLEDGVALADEPLRAAFAQLYPEAWRRIEGRRKFMIETLGIALKPEVLPFSNIPAYLPPFILSPRRVMACQ